MFEERNVTYTGLPTNNPAAKEDLYLPIINTCHQIIEDIGKRTRLIRSEKETTGIPGNANPRLSVTPLERELHQLQDHLLEVRDSIYS